MGTTCRLGHTSPGYTRTVCYYTMYFGHLQCRHGRPKLRTSLQQHGAYILDSDSGLQSSCDLHRHRYRRELSRERDTHRLCRFPRHFAFSSGHHRDRHDHERNRNLGLLGPRRWQPYHFGVLSRRHQFCVQHFVSGVPDGRRHPDEYKHQFQSRPIFSGPGHNVHCHGHPVNFGDSDRQRGFFGQRHTVNFRHAR